MEVLGEVVDQGVVERGFTFAAAGASVPGVLWRPEGVAGPTPLVCLGHGGTQHKRSANVLGLARRFVRHLGYSAVALDAPGHGDRVTDPEQARDARRALEQRILAATGEASAVRTPGVDEAAWLATHRQGAAEWSALLDLLGAEGIDDGRTGYWGLSMGTMIGLPFVAGDHRVRCAVLGLAALAGLPGEAARREAAERLEVPVLFVLQWDDQLMTRASGLALFDAIASKDKAMHVFPGGHIDTPLYERDAYDAFFARHLGG